MSYKNNRHWRALQPFLPVHNRLEEAHTPEEVFLNIPGYRIHLDQYRVASPKARLVLFHGVGGNGRLLSFIARPLHRAGYEVICPDLPLYGYTVYSGTVSYAEWVNIGASVVRQYHRNDVPIFVFGLSAGGMLAYQVACRCKFISGVIATCILDQRDRSITRKTAANRFVGIVATPIISMFHHIAPNLKLPMKLVANMKNIANNTAVADLLMEDDTSSGTWVNVEFLYTMLHPKIEIEPEHFTDIPFLLVHPEKDNWTDVEISRKFYDRLACHKALKLLEGAGHFPLEPKGLRQLEEYCQEFMQQQIGERTWA